MRSLPEMKKYLIWSAPFRRLMLTLEQFLKEQVSACVGWHGIIMSLADMKRQIDEAE